MKDYRDFKDMTLEELNKEYNAVQAYINEISDTPVVENRRLKLQQADQTARIPTTKLLFSEGESNDQ